MGMLFNMFTRVGLWGAACGAAFYAATVIYMYFFAGGALNNAYNSDEAMRSAVIGAAIGAVLGFFKKH